MGLRDRIAARHCLGWSHEYADTARPVSAAVAEAMGVYVRYEGTIAGQDSSHALTAGLRMSW